MRRGWRRLTSSAKGAAVLVVIMTGVFAFMGLFAQPWYFVVGWFLFAGALVAHGQVKTIDTGRI